MRTPASGERQDRLPGPAGQSRRTPGQPEVSVVIVNWNTRELLRRCIASLRAHPPSIPWEIIAVDNASGDGSVDMLEEEFPEVRAIANGTNAGFAAACNQGVAASSGRFALLLNSDAYLIEDAITPLAQVLDGTPQAGMISGLLLNEDFTPQPTCGRFPTLGNSIRHRIGDLFRRAGSRGPRGDFAYPFHSYYEHRQSGPVDWIAGAFMLAKREAIEQAGLLDESIFLFAEEWDWCLRFRKAGYTVHFTPAVRIVHRGSGSWTMGEDLLADARRAGIHAFCRTHYGRLRAAVFLAAAAAAAAVRLARCGLCWALLRRRRPEFAARARSARRSLRWALSPGRKWRISSEDVRPAATAPSAGGPAR